MHSGEYDHVSTGLRSLLCETEAVANVVGNVLDVRFLVEVSQNDRILFFLQSFDLCKQVQGWVEVQIQKTLFFHFVFCRYQHFVIHIIIYNTSIYK